MAEQFLWPINKVVEMASQIGISTLPKNFLQLSSLAPFGSDFKVMENVFSRESQK